MSAYITYFGLGLPAVPSRPSTTRKSTYEEADLAPSSTTYQQYQPIMMSICMLSLDIRVAHIFTFPNLQHSSGRCPFSPQDLVKKLQASSLPKARHICSPGFRMALFSFWRAGWCHCLHVSALSDIVVVFHDLRASIFVPNQLFIYHISPQLHEPSLKWW